MRIEMKGYATSHSQKSGETDDGKKNEYSFFSRTHLSGSVAIGQKEHYISVHGDITVPYIVTVKNEKRKSSKEPVFVPLCRIIKLEHLLDQAGEPRREKGYDLFLAEIELLYPP